MTDQPTIAELLKELRDESTLLLREEIALAKKEIGEKISSTTQNLTYIVAGVLVAFCAIAFLLLAISTVISQTLVNNGVSVGWAIFLGFFIVALVIGAASVGMIIKGVQTLKKLSLVPEKTVETLKEDKTWAQNKIQ
jgi:TRAP-type C4-dicarboxylate transport system permease small subunit